MHEEFLKEGVEYALPNILIRCCSGFGRVRFSNCSDPSPDSAGTNYYYYGNLVTSGGKFGVRLGGSSAEAKRALQGRGYIYNGRFGCGYSIRILAGCRIGYLYDSYTSKESFRSGNVYVTLNGDRVVGIVWEFNLIPYVISRFR